MKQIAEALAAAQAELPLVIAKGNRGHHNAYASFEDTLQKVRPILNKHGLTLLQVGATEADRFVCKTLLLHTSGESVEGAWPVIEAKDAKLHPSQALGGGWSYAKRYSLNSILAIGTGDHDLDASKPPQQEAQPEPQSSNGNGHTGSQQIDPKREMTGEQRQRFTKAVQDSYDDLGDVTVNEILAKHNVRGAAAVVYAATAAQVAEDLKQARAGMMAGAPMN